ncbi:unnamed protein product [Scytosiphon promiscuus]
MILRTLLRAGRNNPAAAGLGVGLGLAASLSERRQQESPSHAKSVSDATPDAQRTRYEPPLPPPKARSTSEPTLREDVMGSYEDRIRNFSSAERVFEFFASVTNEKGTFMTPADFARSITPYQHRIGEKVGSDNFKYNFQAKNNKPTKAEQESYKAVLKAIMEDSRVTPQEVRSMLNARERFNISAEAHLKVLAEIGVTQSQLDALAEARGGISRDSFLAMVDMDGDGLISYEEYMLFRTLLSLPRRKLSIAFRMFDRDDSGAVDSYELDSFMEVLRGETNVGRTEDKAHKKDRKHSDVANKLFLSGNGSGELTLAQFSMFVRLLQREALVMQFNQCDQRGEGLLTATDFAKFLVTKVNVDRRMYKEYLRRAESEKIAQLEVDISLEEFLAFQEVLQHLPEMEVAMKVSGCVEGKGLDRQEFVRAVQAALEGGRRRQEQASDPFLLKAVPMRTRKRDFLRQKIFGTKNASSADGGDAAATAGVSPKGGSGDVEKEAALLPGSKVLPASIVDTLFALLDVNDDGRLNQEEFMTLMKRQTAIPDPPRTIGVMSFMRRLKDCVGDVFL